MNVWADGASSRPPLAFRRVGDQAMTEFDVDPDGLPKGQDCPVCGLPLEPGHIDDTLALVWFCPSHGPVGRTDNPLAPGM